VKARKVKERLHTPPLAFAACGNIAAEQRRRKISAKWRTGVAAE